MPHYLPYLTPKEIAALEYERLLMTGKPEDLPKIHACHTCGRCYKIRSTLNRHQRYECGIARKKLACEICGKKFSRPDNLKQHEQTHVTIFFSGEGGDFASQANGPNNGPNFSVAVKTELGGPISAEGRSPLMADANVSTDDGDKITVTPQIYLIEDSKNYPIPTQPVLQKLQVPSPAGLQKMGIQKIQLQNPSQN